MNSIKALREKMNMSQGTLAKLCNVHQTAVSQWETGRTSPDTKLLPVIAGIFGVSVDEVLGNSPDTKTSIPVLGYVKAGIPIEAVQDIIDYEEIPESLAKQGDFFALKIKGDSMSPRICQDDVVIVRKQSDVDSGDIAVVMINGTDATVKKVIKKGSSLTLVPFNTDYEPMMFGPDEIVSLPVQIAGKVVELRGKF
ncbi:MAG: helix-turn-helix domain-containing protein [Clostridiales bacterium]|nr:helix-turn-helix domain-containing protein [Clostridiales bacterium]